MIKIINNTDFYYKELGEIIDNISWSNRGDTNYVGKIDIIRVKFKRVNLRIQVRTLKKSVEWRFDFDEKEQERVGRRK